MSTHINIHNVERIEVQRVNHSDFVEHGITFCLRDGTEVSLSGFAPKALPIVELSDKDSYAVRQARRMQEEAA